MAVAIIVGIVISTAGLGYITFMPFSCYKKGHFQNRSRGVNTTHPVTYNQSAGVVQTTAQLGGSTQPATQ